MWTTREWYECLARTTAYEKRSAKYNSIKKLRTHGPTTRGVESDAEGYCQYEERYNIRNLTSRQWWFMLAQTEVDPKE